MARNTGTFEFPSNFEVLKAAPLDARTKVGLKTDLTGLPFPYTGMIVSVTEDGDDNGTYVLEGSDASVVSSWKKVTDTLIQSMDYTGNLLTITMSDGTSHTATINTSGSSVTVPTGESGVSSVTTSLNSVIGTLKFISSSE